MILVFSVDIKVLEDYILSYTSQVFVKYLIIKHLMTGKCGMCVKGPGSTSDLPAWAHAGVAEPLALQ